MDRQLCSIWLAQKIGAGSPCADNILEHFGDARAAYMAGRDELLKVPGLGGDIVRALCDKSLDEAERIMEDCLAGGFSVVTTDDEAYPDRLRNIPARPVALYVRGTLPSIDDEVCIAVVGTRSYSVYGGKVAERMAGELAKMGVVVISGMARGLDTFAHKGALKVNGRTIAVLGSGIDVVYPKENRDIYEFIATGGAVLSEYPPGTPPHGHNFPVRNRIISGLSLGVLVVEADRKSGALITARCALEQGRDVFAIPGNITSPTSEGANQLIRDGAKLVQSPLDIIMEYITNFPEKIMQAGRAEKYPQSGERAVPVAASPVAGYVPGGAQNGDMGLSNDERVVYNILTDDPLDADAITELSGLPFPKVAASLTMLEMKEKALRLPGGRYARR